VTQSKLVFFGNSTLTVDGDPEKVVGTLKNGWAQLNRAAEGEQPQWVWVNQDQVFYVEQASGEPPNVGLA
jgi:hypothetical protein